MRPLGAAPTGGRVLAYTHLHPRRPLQTEGESNPLKFSQTFHLAPLNGSYVVTNGAWRRVMLGCSPLGLRAI